MNDFIVVLMMRSSCRPVCRRNFSDNKHSAVKQENTYMFASHAKKEIALL
jgi:hypothetical protein